MDPYLRSHVLFPLVELLGQRNISHKLKLLQKDAKLPWSARKARTQIQLSYILSEAQANVPYYKDLFRSLQFDPEDIKIDLGYLNELPYLTKDIIREQGARLLNQSRPRNKCHIRKTGGSTGPTLPVFYDSESLDWTAAEHIHVVGFTGHKLCRREVLITPESTTRSSNKNTIENFIKNFTLNRNIINSGALDSESLEKIWRKLEKTQPYLVQGPPSVLYALALHLESKGMAPQKVFNAFESTGETLDHTKRQAIERQFLCKVYNRYGTAEFGVVAHSRTEYDQLEVVDYLVYPETYSLGNGLNEIVLTGLTNPVMPLIRYKTGDIGNVEFDHDRFWISKLQGRVHDLVYIANKPVSTTFIQNLMDQIGGVDEFQIHICPEGSKILKVVPSNEANKDHLSAKFKKIFGNEFKIEFTSFNNLVLQGWRSKFRYVVRQSR